MADEQQETREPRSKPVMVRVPLEMWRDLDTMAKRELSTVAAILRRLAKERLDEIQQGSRQ